MESEEEAIQRLTLKGWALLLWEYRKLEPVEGTREWHDFQMVGKLLQEATRDDKRRAGPYYKA